jgi:hypothetical protein
MSLEGFKRIGRTRWIVTATGWKEWRDCQLVTANQKNENRPHDQCAATPAAQLAIVSTCAASSSKVERYASGLARTSRSTRPITGNSRSRASSRRRRLVRFRSTMVRPCFGTTTPTREWGNREVETRASRHSVCIRLPARRTSSRSASLVSRRLRGKPRLLYAGVFGG